MMAWLIREKAFDQPYKMNYITFAEAEERNKGSELLDAFLGERWSSFRR